MERINLTSDFSISRIIKGGWQLSQGHSEGNTQTAIQDMFRFVELGITTFDCADIYTGVEELIGNFLKQHKQQSNHTSVQVLTKYVPDYDVLHTIGHEYVEKIIDRSLTRLGVDQLDMVQFSWWNYGVPRWVENAHHLMRLREKGKIKLISGTNFNTQAVQAMLDAGIHLSTLQVQYSILDRRPETQLSSLCGIHGIKLLCYGTVAGGFLSEHWLGKPEPQPPFENRSLVKYKLIIDDFGGWDLLQELLRTLSHIAEARRVSLSQVATRYILEKQNVGALIIGARNAGHASENLNVFSFSLSADDLKKIETVLQQRQGPTGDVFDLERIKDGPHGKIMRYNLNQA